MHGPAAKEDLHDLIRTSHMRIEAVQASHIEIALSAYERFWKRRGHAARLNFGDCFSYALAKATGAPLLFKGNDFSHTDIPSVL
jgi:ribonuclease VapC